MSESYAVSEKRELLLERVRKFMLDNGGIVKKSQLAGLGIDYRRILDFVEKGDILRIKSGYYAVHLSDFTEEELVAKLFPDCVLNLENALYAYGYIKKKPYGWRLAVDKNTSKSRFKMDYPKIIPMYAEPETLQLGVTEIQLSDVTVRIFEKERLICECLKYEDKMDRERFKEGLMAYIKDPKKDIAKLMYYAKERKVVTVRIFEKERLICECLKYEDKMDRERFKEGLMAYIKDPKKDIAKLMYYAKERKVVKKVQNMIGVWL